MKCYGNIWSVQADSVPPSSRINAVVLQRGAFQDTGCIKVTY